MGNRCDGRLSALGNPTGGHKGCLVYFASMSGCAILGFR
jgi:hypothetical protein